MNQKQHRISIETPEHFELQFELAGMGTRFLAYLVDRLIQLGIFLGVVITVLVASGAVAGLLHPLDLSSHIGKRWGSGP